MAENTKIEWATHTFNPWTGCTRISAACDYCYAEIWAKRSGLVKWGHKEPRRRTTEANWKKPLKWDAAARDAGRIDSVFCASLADWADTEAPDEWRDDLFTNLIAKTPNLEWLLLSKRQNPAFQYLVQLPTLLENVRVGFTVENEEMARMRIPYLQRLASKGWKTFVSYGPALGPINWGLYLDPNGPFANAVQWIVAEGESGHNARPTHPDWIRSCRDACKKVGAPFLWKQWGEYLPVGQTLPGYGKIHGATAVRPARMKLHYGGTPAQAPKHAFAERGVAFTSTDDGLLCFRVGKDASGRLLDGVLLDEFPESLVA